METTAPKPNPLLPPPDPASTEPRKRGLLLSYLQSAIGITIVLGAFALVAISVYMVEIISGLPTLEELENPRPDLSTRVLSADGQQLDMFFVHNRTYIRYDSIPKAFVQGLIATEDQKFYDHWGVDVDRILKAFVKNLMSFNMTKEGASTITQQLARNLYISKEVSFTRKIREQLTAVQIERTYTKNEIMEMYANAVYFGRGAYGIQVAAEVYFNKSPIELTVDECAFLVGLLKGPENYDPEQHYDRAIERRNTVMQLMVQQGYLSGNEYDQSVAKPIMLVKHEVQPSPAAYFVETVRLLLQREPQLQKYNLYRDGLVIYTTLDTRIQQHANQAVRDQLEPFQRQFNHVWSWHGHSDLLEMMVDRAIRDLPRYKRATSEDEKARVMQEYIRRPQFIDSVKKVTTQVEIGFVAMEAKTGYVRAMVGGTDATAGRSLNHVTQIRRQPGSSFKPFVYACALRNGMTPSSSVNSAPFIYHLPGGGTWHPKGGKGGWVPLRTGLKFSINTVAARLICEKTSPAEVIRLVKDMGIKSPIPEVVSIALGSAEVTPLEMVGAYTAFANEGVYVEPTFILKIEDRFGHVIYQPQKNMHEVMPPRVANSMVSMMRGVVDGGTASSIRHWFGYAAAGKTGTTQDFADAWFIGFTPELVAGAWLGFDDHRVKFGGSYGQGGAAAAPIWGRFMKLVYDDDRLSYQQLNFDGLPMRDYSGGGYSVSRVHMKNSSVPKDAIEDVVPPGNDNGGGGNDNGGDGGDKGNAPPPPDTKPDAPPTAPSDPPK